MFKEQIIGEVKGQRSTLSERKFKRYQRAEKVTIY